MAELETGRGKSWGAFVIAAGIALFFTVPAGCAGQDRRPAQYAELTKRASFDLKCDKVKVTPIKEDEYMSCAGNVQHAQTAGVTCGEQRATYEMVGGRWLMNNESGPTEK